MISMAAFWLLAGLLALMGCGSDTSTGEDQIPPARPTRLRVDRIGDGEIWLSWDPVAEKRVAYVVYRSIGGQQPVPVDTTAKTSFRDLGLEYQSEYTYYVTAIDRAGNESFPSNPAGGQPLNNLAPLAPVKLRAIAHNLVLLSQRDIALDWEANAETDLVGYRVYRSTSAGFSLSQDRLRAVVTRPRFVDDQVEVGTTYYYRVTAVDRGGKESLPSEEASDLPLPLPELIAPIQGELTSSTPTFRWHPVTGAKCYQVIVTTSPTSGEISAMPLTQAPTAVFVGRYFAEDKAYALKSGQIYYWKVVASTWTDGRENSVSQIESFKVR